MRHFFEVIVEGIAKALLEVHRRAASAVPVGLCVRAPRSWWVVDDLRPRVHVRLEPWVEHLVAEDGLVVLRQLGWSLALRLRHRAGPRVLRLRRL